MGVIPLPKYKHCSVTGDNITGGLLATRHLIQIGRERIAFLGGPPEDSEVGQRFKGYETALEEAGRSVGSGACGIW